MGFIGSNAALRLAAAGARVTVIDSRDPSCGANFHNLAAAPGVRVVEADIGDAAAVAGLVRGADAVFNFAGEISHIRSMLDPGRDAAINAAAQLRFLEECARQSPGIRIVYAGTRQIYGVPQYLPVDEEHPVRPVDFNGVHKYAGIAYHLLWSGMGRVDARVLCLTNVYGPRMALNIPGQGFLGHFLRRALLGDPIEIFGDGRQLRDPVYVDDAVEAFLLAGAADRRRAGARLWNVGGPASLDLAEIAAIISRAAGAPEPVYRPFPQGGKAIDIGSYTTDSSRIRRDLGWRPSVPFADGIRRTIDWYRRELPHYLPHCAAARQS